MATDCPSHDSRCTPEHCILDAAHPQHAEQERLKGWRFPTAGEGHDIGWAVSEMRHHGGKVRRSGWNGKGMFLVFQKGYPDGIPINANTAQATGIAQGTVCRFSPYIMARSADGSFAPWSAWTEDLLATDWELAT